jgi:hypothetical protein
LWIGFSAGLLQYLKLLFFPAIQELYYKMTKDNNVISSVNAVVQICKDHKHNDLHQAFFSLFLKYNCALKNQGGTTYGSSDGK